MTLEARGVCGSGTCKAEISLRRTSVKGCVEADCGTKEHLCTWMLVCGESFGGAGISADLIQTGALFEGRRNSDELTSASALGIRASDRVEYAPHGAKAPEGAVLGS